MKTLHTSTYYYFTWTREINGAIAYQSFYTDALAKRFAREFSKVK